MLIGIRFPCFPDAAFVILNSVFHCASCKGKVIPVQAVEALRVARG
jgi:hypothetical protein